MQADAIAITAPAGPFDRKSEAPGEVQPLSQATDAADATLVNELLEAGKKPCSAYQMDKCEHLESHSDMLHCCAYCMYARRRRVDVHGETSCVAKFRSKSYSKPPDDQ